MLEKVKELLVEELQINPDDITMDAELSKDLNINSIELADLIMLCEEKFGIEINEEACLAHPYQVHTLRHYTGALTDIRPAKTEFYF